jgi:5-(carboxyamino)imidazole ribonucleotide synthase
VLDPVADAATDALAERVRGEYDDFAALAEFVRGLDVATYEFENVPVATARWLAERVPVHPPPEALSVAQDRVEEKSFFRSLDIPTPEFRAIADRKQFDSALSDIGLPAVLKTRRFGYDGKGQVVIRERDEAVAAWERLGGRPLILEHFVPFDSELSILGVRGRDGATAFYPLVENRHCDGILSESLAPAPGAEARLQGQAEDFAQRVLSRLGYVGVLAIEFFGVGSRLVVNEMAPRVHNSGHWTIDGASVSQFEQHIRAVAGWPLAEPVRRGRIEMFNLIGAEAEDYAKWLVTPGASVHLYGKSVWRPGRKMGHVTRVFPE